VGPNFPDPRFGGCSARPRRQASGLPSLAVVPEAYPIRPISRGRSRMVRATTTPRLHKVLRKSATFTAVSCRTLDMGITLEQMRDTEHLTKLKEGVKTWNAGRKGNAYFVPDLRGADLSGANLMEADLVGANFRGARLVRGSHWGEPRPSEAPRGRPQPRAARRQVVSCCPRGKPRQSEGPRGESQPCGPKQGGFLLRRPQQGGPQQRRPYAHVRP
jgi:hypothetical protein